MQKVLSNVSIVSGVDSTDMGELNGGDGDNNNLVNFLDFSVLANSFNISNGAPGFDINADYNGDGLVNFLDFSVLANNFSVIGNQYPVDGQ